MTMPFFKKPFTFTQPDGTKLEVVGTGNQHYAVFETRDGYTVVQDPATGFFEYASVSDDADDLLPTGVVPGALQPAVMGLQPGARISRDAAHAKVRSIVGLPPGGSRWQERRNNRRALKRMGDGGIAAAPPHRTTTGDFVGLCLLVQFPDVPGTIKREEVEAFCNQKGYSGFGNNGSVYDYFFENSAGKLRYNTIVADYYTAKHPRAYYTNEKVKQPVRAWELIKEAITALKKKGFDFSRLTVDEDSYVYALNVYYAGECINNWGKGLWPHAYHLERKVKLADGIYAYDYQFTDMGKELTLGTYCHENGHMICDFPDLYDYGYESSGVGVYCLMCAGGLPDPKNPAHVGAYLKYRAGWATRVTSLTDNFEGVAEAGKNEFFIHRKSDTEYFIIENRQAAGRDKKLTSSGLAVLMDPLGIC